MFCEFKNTKYFNIPGGTIGWIYPDHPQQEQTLALVEMDGVYPDKGYSINQVCTETLFIISGELELTVDQNKYLLKAKDTFMILPGQKYKSRGNVKLLDIITPSWDKNQNQIID